MNAIICQFYKCALKFELLITIMWLTLHFNKCCFFFITKQAAKNQGAMRAWFKDLAGNKPLSSLGRKVILFSLCIFCCRQFCISFTLLLVKFWVFCVITYTSVDMLCIHVYIGAYIQQERRGVFHSVWVCSTHD